MRHFHFFLVALFLLVFMAVPGSSLAERRGEGRGSDYGNPPRQAEPNGANYEERERERYEERNRYETDEGEGKQEMEPERHREEKTEREMKEEGKGSEQGQESREEHRRKWWRFWE